MNMKATVLQKSTITNPNHRGLATTTTTTTSKKHAVSGSSSTNQIYLVPELVNVHPLKASVWKRCMCLPSILFRLNSLLLAEELRREIASGTGVGVPWIDDDHKKNAFERLEFEWDARKELEMSSVPDVEIDLATIEHQKKQQSLNPTPASTTATTSAVSSTASSGKTATSSSSTTSSSLEKTGGSSPLVDSDGVDSGVDSAWNFEISVWDESCLKEINNPSQSADSKTASTTNAAKLKMPNTMFSFVANLPVDFLKTNKPSSSAAAGETPTGWNDLSNSKTLFIDPNDLDLLADEFIDSDEEVSLRFIY